MARDAQAIFDEALALPEAQRSRLVELLLDSIHGPIEPEIDAELAREAERRLRKYDGDPTTGIPADEALRRANEAVRQRR